MRQSLDFIIGGMPRGGTTVLAILFGLHRDAFCYGAETHLVPLMTEFASNAPVPKASLDYAERILFQQSKQVLIDMPQHSVARGASPRSLIFKEADVYKLSRDIASLLRAGLYGNALMTASLEVLRKRMRSRTWARFLGEKTPNNVFAFEQFGLLNTKAAFVMMREPYSVIKSMRKRGDDNRDWSASIFRSDLISLIGLYKQYADAAIKAEKRNNATLIRYESLIEEPTSLISDIYQSAGLKSRGRIVNAGAKLIRNIQLEDGWPAFSPAEQVLIHALTRGVREASGYDSAFYGARGYVPHDDIDITIEADRVMPMSGTYSVVEVEGGFWMMESGVLMLHTQPQTTRLDMKFWSSFPKTIFSGDERPTLSIQAYGEQVAGGNVITAEVDNDGHLFITLDLASIPPTLELKSSVIRLVRFTASHAFRPYLTPSPQNANERVGDDRRLMSFLYMGCTAS